MNDYDKKVLDAITEANYIVVTEYREPKAAWCSLKVTDRMLLGDAKKLCDEQKPEKNYTYWVAHHKSKWQKL